MAKEFYVGFGEKIPWRDLPTFVRVSLTYDDVLLTPQSSSIESRKQVNTEVQFGSYTLRYPIVTAPMDTITGEKMIREMARLGGIGTLPRGNLLDRLYLCEKFSKDDIPCLYAVGLKNGHEEASYLKERGAQMVLIDVAHGGLEKVKRTASEIKNRLGMIVVAGNIATYTQAKSYQEYGIDIARVGIGGGGLCTTRLIAGSGVPQLSAIFDTSETGIYVIADGGIRYPGDVAKAIAAGARMVMIGSMFAGTDESPGKIDSEGMKVTRGQASETYMYDYDVEVNEFRAGEGIETKVPAKGSVGKIFQKIAGGLRSGMSYSGVRTIDEFQQKALFNLVSSSVHRENQPHIIFQQ